METGGWIKGKPDSAKPKAATPEIVTGERNCSPYILVLTLQKSVTSPRARLRRTDSGDALTGAPKSGLLLLVNPLLFVCLAGRKSPQRSRRALIATVIAVIMTPPAGSGRRLSDTQGALDLVTRLQRSISSFQSNYLELYHQEGPIGMLSQVGAPTSLAGSRGRSCSCSLACALGLPTLPPSNSLGLLLRCGFPSTARTGKSRSEPRWADQQSVLQSPRLWLAELEHAGQHCRAALQCSGQPMATANTAGNALCGWWHRGHAGALSVPLKPDVLCNQHVTRNPAGCAWEGPSLLAGKLCGHAIRCILKAERRTSCTCAYCPPHACPPSLLGDVSMTRRRRRGP